jgi:hypothetical protein
MIEPEDGRARGPTSAEVIAGLEVLAAVLTVAGFAIAVVVYVPAALREAQLPSTPSVWLIWIVATATAVGGGFLWFLRSKGTYFGGTTAEPRGREAMWWAFLTCLPNAGALIWLATTYLKLDLIWSLVGAALSLIGVIVAARLFYGSGHHPDRAGVRIWVEASHMSRVVTEVFIAAIWGLMLGMGALVPVWVLSLLMSRAGNALNVVTALGLALLAPALSVFLVVLVTQPGTTGDSQRGIVAGICLRVGLLFALVLVLLP